MAWSDWSGTVSVLLGGGLTLAGGYLADLRSRGRARDEKLAAQLVALQEATWAFNAEAHPLRRTTSALPPVQQKVVQASYNAIIQLRAPQRRQRRAREACARLMSELTHDFNHGLVDWNSSGSTDSKQKALNAALGLGGLVARFVVMPKSLIKMEVGDFYALMDSARADRSQP